MSSAIKIHQSAMNTNKVTCKIHNFSCHFSLPFLTLDLCQWRQPTKFDQPMAKLTRLSNSYFHPLSLTAIQKLSCTLHSQTPLQSIEPPSLIGHSCTARTSEICATTLHDSRFKPNWKTMAQADFSVAMAICTLSRTFSFPDYYFPAMTRVYASSQNSASHKRHQPYKVKVAIIRSSGFLTIYSPT